MDQALLEAQAQRLTERVSRKGITTQSATVLSIFLSVLPQLVSCWFDEDETEPEQINAAIKAKHEKNAKRLERKTAVAIRRKAPRGKKPPAADAAVMAQETIADACEAAPEKVAAFFVGCRG